MKDNQWSEMMSNLVSMYSNQTTGTFFEVLPTIRETTLTEKILNIFYFFGYWLTYPLFAVVHEIIEGVKSAYWDVWDD